MASEEKVKIVCLCGSTRFEKEFIEIAKRLTLEGKIVLTVNVFWRNENLSSEQLTVLDEVHLRKIDLADLVHILNIDGYIGEGTKREIAYAQSLGKLITYENR